MYVDDGYIKTKLSVSLQVLTDLKGVLKEDVGLELNVSKTSVLPKGVSQRAGLDVTHIIINTRPTLTHLSGDVLLASFCDEGSVGVPIGIGVPDPQVSPGHPTPIY